MILLDGFHLFPVLQSGYSSGTGWQKWAGLQPRCDLFGVGTTWHFGWLVCCGPQRRVSATCGRALLTDEPATLAALLDPLKRTNRQLRNPQSLMEGSTNFINVLLHFVHLFSGLWTIRTLGYRPRRFLRRLSLFCCSQSTNRTWK